VANKTIFFMTNPQSIFLNSPVPPPEEAFPTATEFLVPLPICGARPAA
jgi:hypothetical protein